MVKKITKKEELGKKMEKISKKTEYFYGIGRRKTAIAMAKLFKADKPSFDNWSVNKKRISEYFPVSKLQNIITAPLDKTSLRDKFKAEIISKGGGKNGQAEAIRLAISRALVKFDGGLKKILKSHSYLTRDARKVERKKPGLKKARRAPQWQKR